jgi:hypothetical protein
MPFRESTILRGVVLFCAETYFIKEDKISVL